MNKVLSIIIFIIVTLLGCSCNNSKKQSEDEKSISGSRKLSTKLASSNTPVVIIANCEDSNVFKNFNIINDSYLFGSNHKNSNKKIFKDSMVLKLFGINSPQIMEVWTSGKTDIYSTKILVKPYDTIRFKMKKGQFQFSGPNEAEKSFFQAMNIETPDYSSNNYYHDIKEYGNRVELIYKSKLEFFSNYISNREVTSEAIDLIRKDLKYAYLYNLIEPRNIKANGDVYLNEQDGLRTILQKEAQSSEKLLNLSEYFGNIELKDFTERPDLNNYLFKNALNPYIRYYFLESDNLPYSENRLLEEKHFIENNLHGDVKNYAMARMISDYYKNGFGISKSNKTLLQNIINNFKSKDLAIDYIKRMEEIESGLNSNNLQFSDKVLDSKFINAAGDTIRFKKILTDAGKKIKIISFWASWCPPCIRDIRQKNDFRQKIAIENSVTWIYLSLDKEKQDWIKESKLLQPNLSSSHNYFILNNFNSKISKDLKIKSIPRYIILDETNNILLENAPTLHNENKFEQTLERILLTTEKST